VPTLLEIAEHADVPIEGVLRVVNGDAVSDAVAERVRKAMAELGAPGAGVVESVNVLGSGRPRVGEVVEARQSVDARSSEAAERARNELLETLARAAAELEMSLPEDVGSVVYEALRVEVQPVAQRMTQVGSLLEQLTSAVAEIRAETGAERRERLDDVKLLVDLIETGWRSVDRRLGRLEVMLERRERMLDQREYRL
jgi:hypothetical protein